MILTVVCALLTAALLAYVFSPYAEVADAPGKTRLAHLQERKEVIYENLRDLSFEHRAGKLPDADYEAVRSSLEAEAAALLTEIAELERNSH